MAKRILGVVAGLAVWVIIVIVADTIMRLSWPAYASVADAPVWYHLTFLVSLVPLSYLGGTIGHIGRPLVPASS
jgi:hypothetical protein